jgi:nucleotide-binding universal stress UspA family protein
MYTDILLATDLQASHYELCQKGAAIANSFKAKLYLFHAIEPPAALQLAQGLGFAEFDMPTKENALEVLGVLGEALKIPPARQIVVVGSPRQMIVAQARDWSCNLIIIGSHTPSNFTKLLGSTAHAVVHHASCDVLTLRAQESALS